MVIPVWNQSFTVNVKRCDEDHQKLFVLIQRLHETIETPQGRVVALETIRELAEYSRVHFSAEEALLEKTKFPALLSHRLQHHTFMEKVEVLRKSLDLAPETTQVAMVEYIKNWLVRHIKTVDRLYSAHLNQNGIR